MVPDYAMPDALCVPYWRFGIRETLEALALEAARDVGVILIGPDPDLMADVVAKADAPDNIAMVAGAFDTPWLRDHAPISVQTAGGTAYVRPKRPGDLRPHDAQLFETIFRAQTTRSNAVLASGNIVAGPEGVAVSTFSVLRDNGLTDPEVLRGDAIDLGISDWLFVPPFPDDISRHTDCMIRFLAPDLCAVLMRRDSAGATEVSYAMIDAIGAARPDIEVLPLTGTVRGRDFNSPMNWIQLGKRLLIPDFGDGTGFTDMARDSLSARGFDLCPVPTGTARLGGALRCLTATIFAD